MQTTGNRVVGYEVIKEVENVRFLKVDIADHPFDHKQLKTNYTFVRTW